ncbi:trophinin [Vigna unguiculata]|uniref:trophinin n=1 Tax=Vigna unguiculata TaxID=3917 RepID=UPI00101709D5|nr:trophinin [Vigna unguiculata]
MNSNYGQSNTNKSPSVSLNNFNFDFDLGIGSNRPKSLNDQKNPKPSYSTTTTTTSSYSYQYSSAQPNKQPSWTHQPAPTQTTALPGGPPSMVGDIFGKSWGTTQPSAASKNIGVVDKNPNLFGDLVSSALGQGSKSTGTNVPLKNATPTPNKTSFSMGNMANSLPKTGATPQSSASWASSSGGFSVNANKTPNLGGTSMRNTGSGIGTSSNNKDPFSSLSGFGSKQSATLNSAAKGPKVASRDDGFGDFQNASKSSSDGFGDFQNASKPSSAAFSSAASPGIDFNFAGSAAPTQNPVQRSGGGDDPLNMFFTAASSPAVGGAASASDGFGGQDDWGLDSEFGGGGHDVGGTTTELEGLPPPPAGVSGSTAKGKGMDNYKQGQFADAIKWLSWAIVLLEKAGDATAVAEVLSCRSSCYKEVGEYKKAVADCTKILENDETNVAVLVQRALLYESMEKYKLGSEDLRTVLKIDPSNRIARSTVHRLAQMAG